LLSHWL